MVKEKKIIKGVKFASCNGLFNNRLVRKIYFICLFFNYEKKLRVGLKLNTIQMYYQKK